MEQFPKNNGVTTLNGAIDGSQTSIVVTDGSVFPSSGNFRLLIDSEIMLCTARSSNTLTVTRAQEGTSGASHSDTTSVVSPITETSLKKFRSDAIVAGAYSGLFSAGAEGRIYLPEDHVVPIVRDNGSSLDHYFCGQKLTLPIPSDFSWVNQGSASYTTAGTTSINCAGDGAGFNIRCLVKSAPSTPYTITAGIITNAFCKQWLSYGLLFRQSSDGKLSIIDMLGTDTAWTCRVSKADSATSLNADYVVLRAGTTFQWLRIQDNGTNRIYSVSRDGINWITVHTVGRTDFMTANQVGIYISTENGTTPNLSNSINWLHWAQS